MCVSGIRASRFNEDETDHPESIAYFNLPSMIANVTKNMQVISKKQTKKSTYTVEIKQLDY